ncbi:MAG TPA: ATP-binding protein [Frankiaceae bacterium]|nr:ATP-binding protein [Frankiaceae bacterium]
MQVTVRFELPRDAVTIPIIRKLCGRSLEVVGAADDVVDDVELALTEACANVLKHVQQGEVYEVFVGFDEHRAFLDVIDQGVGFDPAALAPSGADDESGRGVLLMRELMDSVHFDSASGSGTTVHLEKKLAWKPDAAIYQLSAVPPGPPSAD